MFKIQGALKKRVVVEKEPISMMNSLGRSTLKVRWKDMIEISNVVVSNRPLRQRGKSPIPTDERESNKREKDHRPLNDDSNINDIYDVDEYELDDEGDIDDDDNDTTTTTTSEESSSSGEDEKISPQRRVNRGKISSAVERMIPSSEKKQRLNAGLGAGMGSLAKITTSEHLLLEPLHATGREFEKEMNERLEKLSRIKVCLCFFAFSN